MANIPSQAKVTKTLSQGVLQEWLVASEKEQGNEIVPGSFSWEYGSRLSGMGMMEHEAPYFDGVSYEVAPIVKPKISQSEQEA